eukprot:7003879-Ditylum_brightwellii.AAC.1
MTAVLNKFPVVSQTAPTFQETFKAYLKERLKISILRDILICQLHNNGKLAHMRFNTYTACHQEWIHHLYSSYLNKTIE